MELRLEKLNVHLHQSSTGDINPWKNWFHKVLSHSHQPSPHHLSYHPSVAQTSSSHGAYMVTLLDLLILSEDT